MLTPAKQRRFHVISFSLSSCLTMHPSMPKQWNICFCRGPPCKKTRRPSQRIACAESQGLKKDPTLFIVASNLVLNDSTRLSPTAVPSSHVRRSATQLRDPKITETVVQARTASAIRWSPEIVAVTGFFLEDGNLSKTRRSVQIGFGSTWILFPAFDSEKKFWTPRL